MFGFLKPIDRQRADPQVNGISCASEEIFQMAYRCASKVTSGKLQAPDQTNQTVKQISYDGTLPWEQTVWVLLVLHEFSVFEMHHFILQTRSFVQPLTPVYDAILELLMRRVHPRVPREGFPALFERSKESVGGYLDAPGDDPFDETTACGLLIRRIMGGKGRDNPIWDVAADAVLEHAQWLDSQKPYAENFRRFDWEKSLRAIGPELRGSGAKT
jgi:hypothetical protein